MPSARLFAKNSLVVISATLITKMLSLVFVAAAARYLGTEGYGRYAFIFAVASLLSVLDSFGLDPVVVREVAAHRTRAGAVLSAACAIRFVVGAASLGIVAMLNALLSKPVYVEVGLWMVGASLVVDAVSASVKAVITAYEKMELTAAVDVGYRALFVLAGLAIIHWDLGFIPLVSCALVASLFTLGLSLLLYRHAIGSFAWRVDRTHVGALWRQGIPFALTGLLVALYFRLDVVMLSVMRGDQEVGWYSAAYSVSESLLLISSAVNTAIFPIFSRMAQETPNSLRRAYALAFKTLLAVGVPVAVCVAVLSQKITLLIFGGSFFNAAAALQILVVVAVVVFCNSLMGFLLYALHHEQIMLKLTLAMLAFNVIANLMVIPTYGFVGAAAVRLCTECLGFWIAFSVVSKRFVRLETLPMIARPALAALATGAVTYALDAYSLAVQIAAGAAVCLVAIAAMGGYTEAEKRLFRSLVFPQ